MRNGNAPIILIGELSTRVLILPMRNGNVGRTTRVPEAHMSFLSYLWGMETDAIHYELARRFEFLSYLWGMETWYGVCYVDKLVIRSYPTYEEWKPASCCFWNAFFNVLILPMRNGNMIMCCTVMLCGMFLSYLWGMETISSLAIWIVLYPVLILPMRNGN